MHYGITKKLSHKYSFDEEVFSGVLMPDMLKMSNAQSKNESHYMDEEGLPDINKYINEKMIGGYSKEEFGYFLHLVQDRIWYKMMLEIRDDWRDCKEDLYSDMNICDRVVLKSLDMDVDDFLKAKNRIKEVAKDDIIKDSINNFFIIREIDKTHVTFITENIFKEYMEKAYKVCEDYIENLNNIKNYRVEL